MQRHIIYDCSSLYTNREESYFKRNVKTYSFGDDLANLGLSRPCFVTLFPKLEFTIQHSTQQTAIVLPPDMANTDSFQ